MRHILVVNGIKVRRPVFLLGTPHSGVELLARALKRAPGLHLTMGRAAVAQVVYAFARRPSIGRGPGAARVLRDALAEAWQITPDACEQCPAACRAAGGAEADPCVSTAELSRFGDATPDLLYSADALLGAFPDARFVQVIRDGRDVAADMIADPRCLTWFKPAMLTERTEFPNPFLGVNKSEHLDRWKSMPVAGKAALRWRSAVRISVDLRRRLPGDQLMTVRYEELRSTPGPVLDTVAAFLEIPVAGAAPDGGGSARPSASRLSMTDLRLVEKVARLELTRLGYLQKSG